VRDEIGARDNAIANLQNKLSGVTLEIEAREVAIAKLESELEAGRGKQLSFPESKPTPEPTPIPTPEPIPELIPETEPEPIPAPGTLNRGELVKYILAKFPNSKINGQKITDAIAGKSKNLPKFERDYGFKYLGKIRGENRFSIP
jgi:hypothetical protein